MRYVFDEDLPAVGVHVGLVEADLYLRRLSLAASCVFFDFLAGPTMAQAFPQVAGNQLPRATGVESAAEFPQPEWVL